MGKGVGLAEEEASVIALLGDAVGEDDVLLVGETIVWDGTRVDVSSTSDNALVISIEITLP